MKVSPEKWEAVKALFEAAQELSPDKVPAFLAESSSDTWVRAEVERLLRENHASRSASSPMGRSLAVTQRLRPRSDFAPGDIIAGSFKIISFRCRRRHGRGVQGRRS